MKIFFCGELIGKNEFLEIRDWKFDKIGDYEALKGGN